MPNSCERKKELERAKFRARSRLARNHQDEFENLLDQELMAMGATPLNKTFSEYGKRYK